MTDRASRRSSDRGAIGPWPMVQWFGAILWPSFFTAAMATVVFFIFVDPLALRDITFPELEITRGGGYTIAFIMFWAATAASSLFTALLLKPLKRRGVKPEQ
ncbi:hypothetical protein IC757_14740 [Wenzhouxiangella sp. AB-CW3]|uniref:hypothetical protein n=1 Tax=Wenzhouxiangella sp. AB-CW3 TaxID=2771012 RepID=UPI00168BAFFD|nr:hypothetical protein [Wenzhouxiangella sp. AB-CW3]QOC22257.1 hypothetical protein IC757_14740 [Wenzhouxiangella sp. AB-CW3]